MLYLNAINMKLLRPLISIFALTLCTQCFNQVSSEVSHEVSSEDIKLNEELIARIESLIQKDLNSLAKARKLRKEFGAQSENSKREDVIGDSIRRNNLIELDKILAEHGWPGEEEIGEDGAYSFFSIVQHAGKDSRPKYLPIIREAVKEGKCRPRYLAGVEDRIATDNNELQIYGDQVKFYPKTETFDVWPILDPENVDKRRASIGLEPIASHLKNRFKLDWDLEKQKIRTREFIAENKKNKMPIEGKKH